jgi:hypothetical protein
MKEKNKSARDTDIVIPHSPKNQSEAKIGCSIKNDIYHALDNHLPCFPQICGTRGLPKRDFFSSTTKFTKIMVKEEGSLVAAGRPSRGRWVLFF